MELQAASLVKQENQVPLGERNTPFIEANTKEVSLSHLKEECTIPVFAKDNEVTISHPQFIEAVMECANSCLLYTSDAADE